MTTSITSTSTYPLVDFLHESVSIQELYDYEILIDPFAGEPLRLLCCFLGWEVHQLPCGHARDLGPLCFGFGAGSWVPHSARLQDVRDQHLDELDIQWNVRVLSK